MLTTHPHRLIRLDDLTGLTMAMSRPARPTNLDW
jgi:hypothetical protein